MVFDRISLDLTAVREVGQEMTRLAGEGAVLILRSTRPEPVPLERLDDPSPADLEYLSLGTARRAPDPGFLQEGPVGSQDPFPFIQLLTQAPAIPGSGTLRVVCGETHRLRQVTDELARFIVKLGKPLPNAARLMWGIVGLSVTALWVLPLLAAILGVLHPLLWAPTAIVAVIGSAALVRWAKPLVREKARARDVVLIDPTPRHEIRLTRANHRRDARVALLGFGSALLVAVLVYFLGIK